MRVFSCAGTLIGKSLCEFPLIWLLENINPPREDSPTNLVANRHLRDVLQAKGYYVRFQEVSGGHDYFPWQATLADGMLALIGKDKASK